VTDPDHLRSAWAWTCHLRAGGSTSWSTWTAAGAASGPAASGPPAGWSVPGAAELELVRRLAERLAPRLTLWLTQGGPPPRLAGVADVVLARSAPGRGTAQQPLPWPGEVPRFGPPPIDPSDVPLDELLRVGTGVLVELLLTGPDGPPAGAQPRRRPWARTPPFVLAGAPVTVAAVRRELARSGHREGGRSPRTLVLAAPLDRALAEVWSARVQAGSAARWQGLVQRCRSSDLLPSTVDVAALARERPGPLDVVVLGPGPGEEVAEQVARLLGVRLDRARGAVAPQGVRDLSPGAVEVLRRANAVLRVRATEERRDRLRRRLVEVLGDASPASEPPLAVPDTCVPWLRGRAERVAGELTGDRYRVHGRAGDLGALGAGAARPTHPRRADALDLLLDACLALAPGGAPDTPTDQEA
jgi:hypothetical protein